jgi:hypothetical protein
MQTSDLIQQLSTQVMPVKRQSLTRRLLLVWSIGFFIALVMLLISTGVRRDLSAAVLTLPFWIKWGYTLSLVVIGVMLVMRFARPEQQSKHVLWWLMLPALLLLLIATYDLAQAPAEQIHHMWMGHSALRCPWNIFAISLPVFVALMLIMRKFAPTQLPTAGFVAGCLAGASGATVYALLCNESAAPFILVWYSLGMLLPGLLGAALGSKILRW